MTTTLPLKIDPARAGRFITGLTTRATDPKTGNARAADVGELDEASLVHWVRCSQRVDESFAPELVKTLLHHAGPCGAPRDVPPPREEDLEREATMKRVREKLVGRANAGDATVAGLAEEAMKWILDLLHALDEPFHPQAATMIALMITEQAGRTKTSRRMWAKYLDEEAPAAVREFQSRLGSRKEDG